jgi:hypothetical protein
MAPTDFEDLLAYIREHRATDAGFEVSYCGRTDTSGDHTPEEIERLTAYARAGVTWWLEPGVRWWITRLAAEQPTLAELIERMRKGPTPSRR